MMTIEVLHGLLRQPERSRHSIMKVRPLNKIFLLLLLQVKLDEYEVWWKNALEVDLRDRDDLSDEGLE